MKVNSDWNKDLKVKFTVQDPCQIVRKSYGDPIAEDLRFVVKSIVGEENFIDMHPNRSNNYCCGGGGGFLQSGYKEERLEYGRIKDRGDLLGYRFLPWAYRRTALGNTNMGTSKGEIPVVPPVFVGRIGGNPSAVPVSYPSGV